MITGSWRRALLAFAVLTAASYASPAPAQQFQGVALGPDDEPLAGVSVALHRVGAGGGSTAATTTTDGDGRFTFETAIQDSALYFAAIRYQDRMYIGPAIRGGADTEGAYEIRAVSEAEAGRVASLLSGGGRTAGPLPSAVTGGGRSATGDAGAIWLVAILALAAAAIFVTTAPGYRRRRGREALVELATIENQLNGRGTAPGPGERDELSRRRDALRERLTRRS